MAASKVISTVWKKKSIPSIKDYSIHSHCKIKISLEYRKPSISWRVYCFRKFLPQAGSEYSSDPNTFKCILKGSGKSLAVAYRSLTFIS